MRAPESEDEGGMDNRIFLVTIAQGGKFIGRHDVVRKLGVSRFRYIVST